MQKNGPANRIATAMSSCQAIVSSAAGHRLRWLILGLLSFATVANYVDRQTLSVLAPVLRAQFHLSEIDYSRVVTAFLLSYTMMYAVSGRIIDRIGVRLGTAAAVLWWSLATMATGLARGLISLEFIRFVLGIGEPGIYPAGLRAIGEWFPEPERATATGIFSSGSAIGAILAPPLVAIVGIHLGWRYAFLIPGAIGLVWLPAWILVYRRPPEREDIAERATDRAANLRGAFQRRSWIQLIRDRRVLAVILPRFASDPVWYFYLFWLPDYLEKSRHFTLAKLGLYGWIPFLFADIGNVLGGVASDRLVRSGLSPRRSRLTVLVGVACLGPVGALVGIVPGRVTVLLISCLVAFLCQSWSTNIGALALDVVAISETSSVIGLMGAVGSIGGIAFSAVLGVIIQHLGYSAAFVVAGALQPIAALILVSLLKPQDSA